jgi:hypothetical protein
LQNLPGWKYLHFSAFADLCKERSTKSNDNVHCGGGKSPYRSRFARRGKRRLPAIDLRVGYRRQMYQICASWIAGKDRYPPWSQSPGTRFTDHALRGETLPSDDRLTRLRLELAYFSGLAWLRANATGGAGVILRFERVRPRRAARFQPLRSHEITPEFLDRTIGR